MATVTAEDVINQIGNGIFQWLCGGLFCGISAAVIAIQIVNLSMVIQQFSDEQPVPLDANQQGLLNSILLIGMLIGSLPIGPIADKYGRKFGNVLSTAICLAFGMLQVFSYSYSMMLFSRFMMGMGVGALQPMGFPTAGELTPTSHRPFFGGSFLFMYFLGQMLTAPLALVTADSLGWQWYLMICNIPSLIAFLGFVLYVPETPQYYLSVQKLEQAKQVLRYMAKQNNQVVKEEMLDALQEEIQDSTERLTMWQKVKQGGTTLASTFMPPYLVQSICLCILFITTQAGWNGLNVWFPTIFATYGVKNLNYYWQATICLAVQIPGAVFSMFVIEWIGRKPLMIILCSLSGVALLFIFIQPDNGVLVLSCISVSMAILSVFWNACFLVTMELYPTKVRGFMSGLTISISYLGGFISTYFTPALLTMDKMLVIVVPIICYFIAALSVFPLKETKGQQLLENSQSQPSINSKKDDSSQDPLLP